MYNAEKNKTTRLKQQKYTRRKAVQTVRKTDNINTTWKSLLILKLSRKNSSLNQFTWKLDLKSSEIPFDGCVSNISHMYRFQF